MRDVEGGVLWAKARKATAESLQEIGRDVLLKAGHTNRAETVPDRDSWGLDDTAQDQLRHALSMGGRVDGGPDLDLDDLGIEP